MSQKQNIEVARLSGIGRLTSDAVTGVTDIVESVHKTVLSMPFLFGAPKQAKTNGLTGLVYKNIRTISEFMGVGIDVLIDQFTAESSLSAGQRGAQAVLNGVLGDHLVNKGNPLAISMCFRRNGLSLDDAGMTEVIKLAKGKIAIMVHGSCRNDLQWQRNGHDHGAELKRDLGYEPIYLYYNTGRHISENGREFSALLEKFTSLSDQQLDMVIVAHSMGGLVSRSACYYSKEIAQNGSKEIAHDSSNQAGHGWLKHLRKLVFLGTPHHGAHLEKAGNLVDVILETNPYSAPFSRLGKIRSSGVTDLRFGNVVDEDWSGRDRFKLSGDKRVPVPLPEGVACYAIAATIGKTANILSDDLVGDGLVMVNSALGRHKKGEFTLSIPLDNQWVGRKIGHLDLLDHADVYAKLKSWLQA